MGRRKNRVLALGGMSMSIALLTAGCLQGGDEGGSGTGASDVDGGGDDGDKVVEILGAFGGTEADSFNKELKAFEEESGIDVKYTGTPDFQTIIASRVRSGNTPDIGLFAQPGTLVELGDEGDVAPVDEVIDLAAVEETLIPGLIDAGTSEDGTVYGAPMRVAVKSLVFVPQDAYNQGGYSKDPATVEDLLEISDEIKADGIAPWCIGYGSEGSTGWVGTDWIEEYMLRLHGPEVYDQWYEHDIPFTDQRVKDAFDAYAEVVKEPGYVRGGSTAIINTTFDQAGSPAFEDPPQCMLHRQGNFVTGFFPASVQKNLDESVDVFYFPPTEDGYDGNPVLGGGDIAAAFNPDDEDTVKVMEYLTAETFGESWAGDGGWLSPHTTFNSSAYVDDTTRKMGEIAANADVFRFDASDLMPTEVGGGTFWEGMVEWTTGDKSTDEVTQEIEDSWPADD